MAALLLFVASVAPSAAQDRSNLVRLLTDSSDFRIRAQAAFALGATGDVGVVEPLGRALRDQNSAVRAAAATALGRIGSPRALPALRRAERDRSAAVRMQITRSVQLINDRQNANSDAPGTETAPEINWQRVRYVVRLGDFENRSGYETDAFAGLLRNEASRHLATERTLAVIPSDESLLSDRDQRELRRRRLPRIRLDGNLTRVERESRQGDISVRCEVNFMISDEPDRVVRGMLSGSARGIEQRRTQNQAGQVRRLAEQALSGAVRSAISDPEDALAAAVRR